jgi:hypothetical protein
MCGRSLWGIDHRDTCRYFGFGNSAWGHLEGRPVQLEKLFRSSEMEAAWKALAAAAGPVAGTLYTTALVQTVLNPTIVYVALSNVLGWPYFPRS